MVPWNYPQALSAFAGARPGRRCPVVLKPPRDRAGRFGFRRGGQEVGRRPVYSTSCRAPRRPGAPGVPSRDQGQLHRSTAAGRAIGEVCGRLLRPVTLELGGKSAAIILDDADLDATMKGLRSASFVNNGQTCYLSSRILAPRSRFTTMWWPRW